MSALQSGPPLGGTVTLIRSLLPSLIPSEQRVAGACVERPDEVAMSSVADLAALTETSASTVVRTCQNLGFRGFQHLRQLLLRDLGAAERASVTRLDPAAGSRGRVPALFEAAARDVRNALGALDYDQFDLATEAIARARRVLIVANGGSGPPAQMVALRFLTSGRPVEAPYDSVTQQLSARFLNADDVCLAITDSGMNTVTLRAVHAAHEAGATIVGVTSYARSRLSELTTHLLVAGEAFHSWGEGAPTGNVTQILLLSALQDAVTRVGGVDEYTRSEVMKKVFDTLVGDSTVEP